jgi:riboflavin kinase/FMN adenylyltransferase
MEGSRELKHGMMNIGNRPTFGGHHKTLEAHIFHFDQDVYGQQLTVSFISRLRAEQRFDSPEALMAQLEDDSRRAEEILNQTTVI